MHCANYLFEKYFSDFVTTDIVQIVKAKRRDAVRFFYIYKFQNFALKRTEKHSLNGGGADWQMKNSIPEFRSMNATIWKETILTQILFSHKICFMFNVHGKKLPSHCDFFERKKRHGDFDWEFGIGSRIDYKTQIEIDRSYLFLKSIVLFIDKDISMVLKWVYSIFGTTQPSIAKLDFVNYNQSRNKTYKIESLYFMSVFMHAMRQSIF